MSPLLLDRLGESNVPRSHLRLHSTASVSTRKTALVSWYKPQVLAWLELGGLSPLLADSDVEARESFSPNP